MILGDFVLIQIKKKTKKKYQNGKNCSLLDNRTPSPTAIYYYHFLCYLIIFLLKKMGTPWKYIWWNVFYRKWCVTIETKLIISFRYFKTARFSYFYFRKKTKLFKQHKTTKILRLTRWFITTWSLKAIFNFRIVRNLRFLVGQQQNVRTWSIHAGAGDDREWCEAVSQLSSPSSPVYFYWMLKVLMGTFSHRHFIVPLAIAQRPRWRRKGTKLHIYNDHTFIAKHLSG